ncbi:MAG TPA: hypothetical protein H9898_04880 [Candidatus Anaerobiospirillum stercoravium]|nr:hypothetical protein [Candidatus Anaerobiospirillum stercoravium]
MASPKNERGGLGIRRWRQVLKDGTDAEHSSRAVPTIVKRSSNHPIALQMLAHNIMLMVYTFYWQSIELREEQGILT